ncbi:MAG: sugar phosphate nucleotidyltransferase [Pseudomonadota bacterium]
MFSVIMAGGSGIRFWPVSRRSRPKQFLDILGKGPMVVETCDRLLPLTREEEMILILGRAHLQEARELLRGRKLHILAEPIGRNTAPCIGLGAIYALYLGCKGPMAFLPADHYISDPKAFVECLQQARDVAESGGLVTLGVVATRPETGYGYIEWSADRPDFWNLAAYKVSAFVEKPGLEKARQYLARGNYFWNAGIFVATPETVLGQIQRYLPNLYRALERLEKSLGTDYWENEFEDVYEKLESVSFDNGIMERTEDQGFVIPCECGWSDVGSWASLYEMREGEYDRDQNVSEGESILIDCKGSLVFSKGGRMVACLGLENCLVVDTSDAVLVSDLDKSQEVRRIIEHLKRSRKVDLL